MSRGPQDKATGAYYTEERIAAALVDWAVRDAGDECLDPSFGGGVFLAAAVARLERLGGGRVHGVELSAAAHGRLPAAVLDSPSCGCLLAGDFLGLGERDLPKVTAIVGNPPFIRFQRIKGEARLLARLRSEQAGLDMPPLAGQWVAFVAHAMTFLAPGGRLGLVLPSELGHAPYARPLLRLLLRRFRDLRLLAFEQPLFPHLDQGALVVLADGHGEGPGLMRAGRVEDASELPRALRSDLPPIDGPSLADGATSLTLELLGRGTRDLYALLRERQPRLGDLATLESGYVTGANAEFHLSEGRRRRLGVPQSAVTRAVFRSRAAAGLEFSETDWQEAAALDHAGWLLTPVGAEGHPVIDRLLSEYRERGIDRRYKTRSRSPWYRVTRVRTPKSFLPALSEKTPRLVLNTAGTAVPNTFHAVEPRAGVDGGWLAAASLTSLARFSFELEGHAMGGGALKLDPGEAREVRLPRPVPLSRPEFDRLDKALRAEGVEAASELADDLLLAAGGVEPSTVRALREAAERLAGMRSRRGRRTPC